MASRIAAAVIFALVSVPLWALTVSLASCDDFEFFDGTGMGLGSDEAQEQAQEWADDQRSRLGCELIQVQALGGVGKAQYREPPPMVLGVISLVAALSVVAAIVLGADGWVGRRPKPPTNSAAETRSA